MDTTGWTACSSIRDARMSPSPAARSWRGVIGLSTNPVGRPQETQGPPPRCWCEVWHLLLFLCVWRVSATVDEGGCGACHHRQLERAETLPASSRPVGRYSSGVRRSTGGDRLRRGPRPNRRRARLPVGAPKDLAASGGPSHSRRPLLNEAIESREQEAMIRNFDQRPRPPDPRPLPTDCEGSKYPDAPPGP